MSSISSNLQKSNYRRVFKKLLASAPAARRAFRDVVGNVIADEVSKYCRSGNSQKFPTFTGSESLTSFNWNSVFAELRQNTPTLYAAVSSSMPKKLRENKDELGPLVSARVGMMLTIPLYTYRCKKFCVLQAINAVQMWESGANKELFKSFNNLGICQSADVTRRNVRKMVAENRAQLEAMETTEHGEANDEEMGLNDDNCLASSVGMVDNADAVDCDIIPQLQVNDSINKDHSYYQNVHEVEVRCSHRRRHINKDNAILECSFCQE